MRLSLEAEMEQACQRWLIARERFRRGAGLAVLDDYWGADHALFAAFVRDWTGTFGSGLFRAYDQFRKLLVEQYEHRRPGQHRTPPPWA